MTRPVSRLVCAGCGVELPTTYRYPFRCPHAGDDDGDHVLRRELDLSQVAFPVDDSDPNPFVRYRRLLYAHHLATSRALTGPALRPTER